MTSFRNKLILPPSLDRPFEPYTPPTEIELHRPTDEQLQATLRIAREAHAEGSGLTFPAADIAAIVAELIERRAAMRPPEPTEIA